MFSMFLSDGFKATSSQAIRMEVASSRPDHLSAAKTSEFFLLVKSPFRCLSGRCCRHCCSDVCFSVPAMSKLTTRTVESLWTASTETTKHLILANETSQQQLAGRPTVEARKFTLFQRFLFSNVFETTINKGSKKMQWCSWTHNRMIRD